MQFAEFSHVLTSNTRPFFAGWFFHIWGNRLWFFHHISAPPHWRTDMIALHFDMAVGQNLVPLVNIKIDC
jgi:hypothetical protein